MITLVMALSVLQAIRDVTGLQAYIKWPNDIVVNGKKVVGILTELLTEPDGSWYLVCGVGINVNQKEFSAELLQTATSLLLEQGGAEIGRESLREKVIEYFRKNYEVFASKGDLGDMLKAYNEFLVNRNATVRVLDPKGEYEGTALGINEKGELLVKESDGNIRNVYAGEVSVRGIYGYV